MPHRGDGQLEIDNLPVERAQRAVTIGRRNCLSAGADSGGERTAANHSLIGSANSPTSIPKPICASCWRALQMRLINRVNELAPWVVADQPRAHR
jgi:hypothetical protein